MSSRSLLLKMSFLAGVGSRIPAARAAGTVTVQSDMAGQAVLVDGDDIGSITPATVQGLAAGPHSIRVVGGCRVGEAEVVVVDGETVDVRIDTRRTPGSLRLEVSPQGAAVAIDGVAQDADGGPTALACGPHTVSVSMPGHLPTLLNVDVEAGQMMTLPIQLVPQGRGKLTLDVTPDDSRVLLDGSELGRGDLERFTLLAGPHILRVEAEGFAPGEYQFVLEDGADITLALPLAALAEPVPVASVPAVEPAPPAAPVSAGPGRSRGRVAGISLTAAGVGVGALATVQLTRMVRYGEEYRDRADAVLATDDASVLAPAHANRYR
ncbi:MAG: PEGA domain-containing protein, partial [Myxococcota bacterium]|nr:PEGA domain-containing protein [Myxococcota bacterium]